MNSLPGVSIVLIEDGQAAKQILHGFSNVELRTPVTATTIFEVASLSKPVFAHTVMKLVEQGQLDLDLPLVEYLPYPEVAEQEQLKLITARMALAHTTGFPNWRPTGKPLRIQFAPGSQFRYSGEGYVYLQKVVEHLTGLSLETLADQHTFKPLGMTHSSFRWPINPPAVGYDSAGQPVPNPTETEPSAAFSLHATAMDLAALVMTGMTGMGQQMTALQIPIDNKVGWGLGWGIQHTPRGDSFWQWGDNRGFHSYAAGFPTNRSGIIILTNSATGLSIFPELVQDLTGLTHPSLEWLNNHYKKHSFTY